MNSFSKVLTAVLVAIAAATGLAPRGAPPRTFCVNAKDCLASVTTSVIGNCTGYTFSFAGAATQDADCSCNNAGNCVPGAIPCAASQPGNVSVPSGDSYQLNGGACTAGTGTPPVSFGSATANCGTSNYNTIVLHPGTTSCNNPLCTLATSAVCGAGGSCSSGTGC